MKKLLLMAALVAGSISLATAQSQKPAVAVTIKTPTLQCEECKQRVENYLAKEEGVYKAVANYKNKTVKVWYYTDRTTVENVRTAIANCGYDADDVTADADSYKKLPKCCKKPEDGGGHKKG